MNSERLNGEYRQIDLQRVIRGIFVACLALILAFIACDYVFNYLDVFDERNIRRIWNIAREQSLPTWFSSIQAQLLGLTVLLIAGIEAPGASRARTAAWIVVGLFFIWIGIDDAAEIHEKLGGALVRMAASGEETEVTAWLLQNPSYSWHTFIAPAFALFGLGILAFLWLRFWRLRLLHWILLGFACWGLAQVMDFIEGLEQVGALYDWLQATFAIERRYGVTHSWKVAEEVLEMLGTTFLWVGFLKYLATIADGLQIRLRYPPRR
jgi:hypothetical protein